MKKLLAIALCVVMMFAAALPVFAGQNDEAVSSIEMELYNEMPYGVEGFEDAFQMRGFTVSPDGKYLYGGFLQANPGRRHLSQYDAAEFVKTGEYVPLAENEESNANFAIGQGNDYCKGIAVDNRGYVFVGVTHANTKYISIYCLTASMKKISFITEDLGASTGINGVATQKIGDKIYLYVLTGYDKDTIRKYDVTDPLNIVPDTTFGQDGVVDYNALTGSTKDSAYIAVDVDGYIYITYLKNSFSGKWSKGSHVMKLKPDGSEIIAETEVREAYGICTAGDYLFVSTHDDFDSCIHVIDKNTMGKVAKIDNYKATSAFSGISFADGYLWVGAHGNVTAMGDPAGAVLRSTERIDITRDPRETEVVEADPTLGEDPVPVEPFSGYSLDRVQINNNTLVPQTDPADPATVPADAKPRSTVTIDSGDKIYILGWVVKEGTSLSKIVYTIDGGEAIDCTGEYRDRPDVAGAFNLAEEAGTNAGFGINEDGMMELTGIDQLEEGEYAIEIKAVFADGSELVLNREDAPGVFTLVVNAKVSGDMNNDGKVNNKDVVTLFRLVAQGNVEYNKVYDFNNDNKINNKDVVALFRFINTK